MLKRRAVVFCGFLGFFMPAAYGLINGVRQPAVHDEFSYLLAASTFADGRLSNPSPPLLEFFEAPHVLVSPTYSSKYPPGQALMLALGQRLTGEPIWGVWLTCGVFAACLCWMLQAWSSRTSAVAVTLLTIVTLGTSSYWSQSYWGGMLGASGAAMLLGGLGRTLHSAGPPRIGVGAAMAAGIVVLANTRPYEGLLICIPAALRLCHWLLRSPRASLPTKLRFVVVPASIVLIAGGVGMGLYNRAVTGSFTRTPYDVHVRQYWQRGVFVFDRVHQPERTPPERVAAFYREHETEPDSGAELRSTVMQNFTARLFALAGTPFGVAYLSPDPGYQGILLWLALLISVWWSQSLRATTVTVIAAVGLECLAWKYLPFYPRLLTLLVVVCWVATFYLTARRNASARFLIGTIAILAVGQSLTLWWWPHYGAPALPLLLAVVATAVQRVARRAPGFAARRLVAATAVIAVVHLSVLGFIVHAYGNNEDGAGGSRGRRRADVLERLEREPGNQLVFVRYADGYTVHDEWVYNPADLNATRVLFAHDLGDRNPELVEAYPNRTVWLAMVSKDEVRLARFGADERQEQ